MQIKYYETAWRDISNSPGWFGKICLLSLVNFIPIFGQIVTFGYLYGWAREIAWGVHAPMPSKLINNDDGRFWRRGWFVLVLVFVFALVPGIISMIGQIMQGTGYSAVRYGEHGVGGSVLGTIGLLIYFVGLIGTFLASILAWIGSMRVSIYDRLSAGFQLGKIWKMFRHDTGGIMRIFGMELLVGLILSIVLSIVITTLMIIVMFAGVAGLMGSGYSPESFQYMTDAQVAQLGMQFLLSAGAVGIICFFVMMFVSFMATVFIDMLVIRAVGYWVCQFDVPRWRGQDDPMPFEMGMGAGVPPMSQPPMYAAPQHVPGPGATPMAGGATGPMAGGVAAPMTGGAAVSSVSGAPMAGGAVEPGVSSVQNAQVGDFGYAHGPQADPQVARTVAEAPVITAQLVDTQAASMPVDGFGSAQAATPTDGLGSTQAAMPVDGFDSSQVAMPFAEEAFQPQGDQPAADADAAGPESGQANPSND